MCVTLLLPLCFNSVTKPQLFIIREKHIGPTVLYSQLEIVNKVDRYFALSFKLGIGHHVDWQQQLQFISGVWIYYQMYTVCEVTWILYDRVLTLVSIPIHAFCISLIAPELLLPFQGKMIRFNCGVPFNIKRIYCDYICTLFLVTIYVVVVKIRGNIY